MRLIDLHVDWLLQYAGECSTFDASLYPSTPSKRGQAEGYLQTTSAAVVSCYRNADDWAKQADPWASLGQLIARIEAEFSGRLLIAADDFDRWLDDEAGMSWAVIGVEGFDSLLRSDADLARIPRLFERGVRLFQPVYSPSSLLGGSSVPGDDRGMTELGIRFLDAVLGGSNSGPRPMLDLAHLNPTSMADALSWFEADPGRSRRLIPVYSHGAPAHPGLESPRAITLDNLRRLRAMGGFVGVGVTPPFFTSIDQIKPAIEAVAAIPFEGREGYEGIGIGTDFLGVSKTLQGLGNATEVVDWFSANFDQATAPSLLLDNARTLLARMVGSRLP